MNGAWKSRSACWTALPLRSMSSRPTRARKLSSSRATHATRGSVFHQSLPSAIRVFLHQAGRRTAPTDIAGRPRPLKIESTDAAIAVEHLADEKQARYL